MDRNFIRRISLILVLMSLAALCACSSSKEGTQIASISLYTYAYDQEGATDLYADGDYAGSARMNIEWSTADPEKQLDFLELTFLGEFSGGYEGQDHLRYRIQNYGEEIDWEETGPRVCKVPGLIKGNKYKVYVSRAGYTDGSFWTNRNGSGKKTVKVDGNRGKGMPASLEEINFFEQSGASIRKDLNVCWINTGNEPLCGVTYEVRYFNTEGEPIEDRSGNTVFYLECSESAEVMPGEKGSGYHISFMYTHDEPAYIEARIVKAVGENGKVFESADETPIKAVFLGKKEYAFRKCKNGSVTSLEKDIRKALKKYGISRNEALIYEREKDFAVLRYDDIDIRFELDGKGKVKYDTVSFVNYFTREESMARTEGQEYDVFSRDMAVAIYSCLITDIKEKAIMEKVTAFFESYYEPLDFGDAYETLGKMTLGMQDEAGEPLYCSVYGAGKEFDYDPREQLFWAYGYIY